MTTQTYKGAIWLKSGGHYVSVSCEATSPSAAKRIIESMYDVKSWQRHMASN
ncbi:hypothetical protein ALE3EI_0453 [Constantimarinum furrinae]|uniref:Uncharacterized protein n=1 Tax=Constantimarinum furrinae TaxID=2562285 RepID=A0A7G8PRS0_9FLAO|nr:hypothetical protein ALE3EI_0453 [Constantimarinum furrinae]